MAEQEKPPLVPRRVLRDFPALRQQAFSSERSARLRAPDEDLSQPAESPEAESDLREKLVQEYRRKP